MNNSHILIVGAGPTGLCLAIALTQQGIPVRIIEALELRTEQSRALGLHSRTLEILEKMGVLEEFLKEGRKIKGAHFYFKGTTFFRVDLSCLDVPYPFLLSIPQSKTEEILENKLASLGVRVERGIRLESLTSLSNGEVITTEWIMGCDGAHSTLRHLLGLSFEGVQLEERFALADVALKKDLPSDEASIYLSGQGMLAFFPLPKSSWYRLISRLPSLPLSSLKEEEILERGWASRFSIHQRLVSKMREGYRFLLGDAAHVHSPVGGQGLNTGVQDAYNLAWKIAFVFKGIKPASFLDSFEQERRPIAKAVLRYTTLGTHLLSGFPSFLAPLVRFIFKWSFLKKKVALSVSEIGVKYKKSCILGSKCFGMLQPGERAPDGRLPSGERLFEKLAHPLHTLLLFGQDEPNGDSRTTVVLKIEMEPRTELHDRYKIKKPCFYLIRPDGYIASCGMSLCCNSQ
ncbi:MAG: hypothetical protein RLZZ453_354 [Chlamydiota bacterium]|jgi:2-polyprenyl-6-methoxyphenol hydroxylase-like FAD-dependent oxidoreductase